MVNDCDLGDFHCTEEGVIGSLFSLVDTDQSVIPAFLFLPVVRLVKQVTGCLFLLVVRDSFGEVEPSL
jgi:hypothetical protein